MCAFPNLEVYRSILESLPTGVCVVDAQKRIVLWSDGAERITGRMRHEVIGHCCVGEALLHCDQQDCEWCNEDCPLARAMKTSHPAEAVGFLFHKAGYEIPVRARAVPVRNERGTIIGAVEIFEEQQQATILDQREKSLNFPGCMDEVTSVASRTMMQSHLRETLGTFAELQVPFGVLLFRLEGLERFRTSSGPDAAAALLRMVARTIEGALLRTDFIGRWADDQFLAILNGCRDEALQAVRERVRRMLASDGIEWWGERRSLPVSIGGATVRPGDSTESLMARAQESLDATSAGRARTATAGGNAPSGS
jgi:two-component system cell cycle response regulator